MASIISVKESEREKRSSIEELLALPDSSLVSVISFDCQLAFRNANGEKQSIHSNSITFLQSQMYQRINLAQKTAVQESTEFVSSNKEVYFFPIARISERMFSLRSWAENVAASSQISSPFAFPFVLQVPAVRVALPSSNDDAFGILQPTWYYDFKISVYCVWRPFERHSYSTKVAFQHKNTQNLTPFLSACLCYCCKAVSWASPLSTAGNYPDT